MMTISSLQSMVKESIFNAVGVPRHSGQKYKWVTGPMTGLPIARTLNIPFTPDWWEYGKLVSIAKYCEKTGVSAEIVQKATPCWVRTNRERIYCDDHAIALATEQDWIEVETKRLADKRIICRVGRFFVEKSERNGHYVYTFFYTHKNKLGMYSSTSEEDGDKHAHRIFSQVVEHTKSVRTGKEASRLVRLTMSECLSLTSGEIPTSVAEKARDTIVAMKAVSNSKPKYKIKDN